MEFVIVRSPAATFVFAYPAGLVTPTPITATQIMLGKSPEKPPQLTAKASSSQSSAPSKGKLLVVDDDAVVRKALGWKLTSAGYQVVFAADASEALETSRRENPEVIILDINFPPDPAISWDGFKLLSWLHRASGGRLVPVLIITGDESPKTRAKALASGAVGFFQKPVDVPSMIAAIDKLIKEPASPE